MNTTLTPQSTDPHRAGRDCIRSILAGYLTKQEAADALRVHERTLDRWHALRTGPPRTVIAQRVYYEIAALRAWVREQNG